MKIKANEFQTKQMLKSALVWLGVIGIVLLALKQLSAK